MVIPQRGCRQCRARPRRRIATIALASAHSAVRKARRRAPHRDESAHFSPAAPYQSAGACGRSKSEEPPFAGRRCGGPDQSGDRCRHRFGSAVGRARGARGADFLAGCTSAIDGYEEELGDIFNAASTARCAAGERAGRYADGGRPDARALSDGWIASPHYWAA